MDAAVRQSAAHRPVIERADVRAFTLSDAQPWDAYVETCAEASFFHRIGWREIIEDVFHHRTHYRVAERRGQIVGILPLDRKSVV